MKKYIEQSNPKLSVIIPIYNAEKFLEQCLDSVLSQTLENIEIICVDDGSTDNSLNIVNRYAKLDKRIIVLKQNNQYAGVARNYGLSVAKGDYIHFLDSDDFLEKDAYKLATEAIDDSDICIFFHKTYDNKTGKTEYRPHYYHSIIGAYEKIKTSFKVDSRHFIYNAVVPWNKIYKREFLLNKEIKFSKLQCANDRYFHFAAVTQAESITVFNAYLINYRINNENSVAGGLGRLKHFECHFKSFMEILSLKNFVSEQEYKQIVDVCMKDMLSFFQKAQGSLKIIIWNKISEFVKTYLGEIITSQYKDFDWYNIYNALISIKGKNKDIIVSLTSFPERISTLNKCIESLFMQTVLPQKVVLWLADSQFPNKEKDLPQELLSLNECGLEICWCNDIRSYKKLIPTLKQYPNNIIVTVDDDVIYSPNLIENLYESYLEMPHCVHAHRVTKMYMFENGIKWIPGGEYFYLTPNSLNKLVGVGGVLYPPHCFHKDIFNEDLFMKLAPTNDDQWFWCMANLNGYFVRSVPDKILKLSYIENTQKYGLTNINDKGLNLFIVQLRNLFDYYPEWLAMMKNDFVGQEKPLMLEYIGYIEKDLYSNRKELNKIKTDFDRGLCNALSINYPQEDYDFYKNLKKKEYPRALRKWLMRVRGFEIDLKNPVYFSEKIQWSKLYSSSRLKAKLADKYAVRHWIEKRIGSEYLIPLIGVYKDFDQIDFSKLPDKFVMKCNHGSGWNIVVKDKKQLVIDTARKQINEWMATNFAYKAGMEMHYKYIKPRIVIEEYLENSGGELVDYKFLCFNGKAKICWVDTGRYTGHKRDLFDMNWNHIPVIFEYPNSSKVIEKPKNFAEMVNLAEKLAKGFDQVRVDFYLLNDGSIKFGEMTFTSGTGTDRFIPRIYDYILGEQIKLNK